MKLFFVFLFMCFCASAQIKPVDQQYMQGENLLLNPGLEHGLTSWTYTGAASRNLETSESLVIAGKNSLRINATAQSFSVTQSSTKYAGTIGGRDAIGLVSVKTNDSTVVICALENNIETNCVKANPNNDAIEYAVKFVGNSTSNGISIKGTSGTGTTYIDSAYVGIMPATMMPEVSQAQIAGEAYFAGTTSCQWTRTSTTIGAFGAVAACPGPTIVRQNIGSWQTTDSDLPRVTVNNLPAGQYKAKFILGAAVTSLSASVIAIYDGTTTCYGTASNDDLTYSSNIIAECSFEYTSSGNRSFELYAASGAGTYNLNNQSTTPPAGTKFILEYYPPKSKIYSQQCTSDLDCENVFSAKVSSAGVVSGENLDWINGDCPIVGTLRECTYTTGLNLSSPMTCVVSTEYNTTLADQVEAEMRGSTSTGLSYSVTVSGVGNNTFPAQIICQKSPPDFKQKNVITGTFVNVVTTPDTGKVSMCSAKISATGVISNNLGGCFSSCTNATTPVCTFTSNYWVSGHIPNCDGASAVNGAADAGTTVTTTTVTHRIDAPIGTPFAGARAISCHGLKQ